MGEELVNKIKIIFNEWDCLNLIAHGAPDDEYEIYINEIIDLYQERKLITEVIHHFYEHFKYNLDHAGNYKPDMLMKECIENITKIYGLLETI